MDPQERMKVAARDSILDEVSVLLEFVDVNCEVSSDYNEIVYDDLSNTAQVVWQMLDKIHESDRSWSMLTNEISKWKVSFESKMRDLYAIVTGARD